MGKTTRKIFGWSHETDNKFGNGFRTVALIAIPIALLLLFL